MIFNQFHQKFYLAAFKLESNIIGAYGQFGYLLERDTKQICCASNSNYRKESILRRYIFPTDTFKRYNDLRFSR